MSNITITSAFTSIADAIRAKTGKSDTMTPAEIPTEIASISGGSGGSGTPVEYIKLNVTEEIIQISNSDDLLVYGEQSTAHYVGINSFNLTTYDDYTDYLSYDSSTNYFTVLADFEGLFKCWVEDYKASSGYPTGALYYNDNELAYYTASGNAQGSTGVTLIKIDCKAGDTFYVRTPTDAGWAKQYIKVYKEDN